ncbi:C40 family peptidase [Christensenella tenuis]|jgi:peptidoglycan DL-endopeptidase CwlO|uniref:Peptidoglycan-binding protein n=1 Tax=Christensenella tenuis TaxID=2763033 RepID=A0ABR7EI30_9FIRM|nr:peptidoglycan-binding protein [Christensenella tenuis]MBC5648769.1 peptidoglycan-binding protein [Christensenella tenuis]
MIKPFGKHRTFVRARRNGNVSSNSESVSRAAVRYRVRKKKRLFTVVTVAVASVMIPIMIASAATGDMKMTPQPEPTAQVQAVAQPQETEEQPDSAATEAPKLTETTQSAAPVASESSAVTAQGETTQPAAPAEQTPAVEEQQPVVTYMEGMTDEKVREIQQRLMDLYYMGRDETTDYFGPQTNQALKYFQRKHGLAVDGAAGPETMALLFSENAKEYSMALGAAGADVENMQERLIELGYPISEATGYFGEETEKAVKYFQRMSGLVEDGSVGHMTEELLYSDQAEKSLEYEQIQAEKEAAKQPAEPSEEAKQEESGSKEDTSSDSGKEESSNSGSSEEESNDSSQEDSAPAEDNSSSSEDSGDTPSYTADAGSVEAFIAVAEAQLGKPYVLGGKGPNSFDCSGLIYYALRESGNDVPYRTSAGWRNTDYPTITSISDLQRGDIICMDGHVAIYLGDNMVLDASSSQNAMVTREFGSWFRNGFICAKRPL